MHCRGTVLGLHRAPTAAADYLALLRSRRGVCLVAFYDQSGGTITDSSFNDGA
ncbi:MAG: hypothetical protein JRN30_02655 [Nitrososphaerota archaeon]|nr:hypothetical protein [Nitrososphaerota archaeon]